MCSKLAGATLEKTPTTTITVETSQLLSGTKGLQLLHILDSALQKFQGHEKWSQATGAGELLAPESPNLEGRKVGALQSLACRGELHL